MTAAFYICPTEYTKPNQLSVAEILVKLPMEKKYQLVEKVFGVCEITSLRTTKLPPSIPLTISGHLKKLTLAILEGFDNKINGNNEDSTKELQNKV